MKRYYFDRHYLLNFHQKKRFKDLVIDADAEIARYKALFKEIEPFITDTVVYVNDALKKGNKVLVEGANAVMLDIDFGTYPYVTSSNTICGGATTVRSILILLILFIICY